MVVQMVQDETLLTFKEAMTYLRVSRSTLYRLMWSGQLTGHKVGSTWRFYRDDLRACVDRDVEMPTLRVAQSAN
jgi:excisionase family DNA binding protein